MSQTPNVNLVSGITPEAIAGFENATRTLVQKAQLDIEKAKLRSQEAQAKDAARLSRELAEKETETQLKIQELVNQGFQQTQAMRGEQEVALEQLRQEGRQEELTFQQDRIEEDRKREDKAAARALELDALRSEIMESQLSVTDPETLEQQRKGLLEATNDKQRTMDKLNQLGEDRAKSADQMVAFIQEVSDVADAQDSILETSNRAAQEAAINGFGFALREGIEKQLPGWTSVLRDAKATSGWLAKGIPQVLLSRSWKALIDWDGANRSELDIAEWTGDEGIKVLLTVNGFAEVAGRETAPQMLLASGKQGNAGDASDALTNLITTGHTAALFLEKKQDATPEQKQKIARDVNRAYEQASQFFTREQIWGFLSGFSAAAGERGEVASELGLQKGLNRLLSKDKGIIQDMDRQLRKLDAVYGAYLNQQRHGGPFNLQEELLSRGVAEKTIKNAIESGDPQSYMEAVEAADYPPTIKRELRAARKRYEESGLLPERAFEEQERELEAATRTADAQIREIAAATGVTDITELQGVEAEVRSLPALRRLIEAQRRQAQELRE